MTRYEARRGADDYEDGSDATGRAVEAPRRSQTGADGQRYVEAIAGARAIRRKAFMEHRYQCDGTIQTCVVRMMNAGLMPFRLLTFEITDGHW